MAGFFDDAFANDGLDDYLFDQEPGFDQPSHLHQDEAVVSSRTPQREDPFSLPGDQSDVDSDSDNEDGLYGSSRLDDSFGGEEFGGEDTVAAAEEYSWRVDHSSGDYRLKGTVLLILTAP